MTTPMMLDHDLPTLPYDILSVIFQNYIDGLFQRTDQPPRPSVQEGPLLLSRICQSWRDAALSTPTLWSAFSIDLSLSYPIISYFLSLAKEAPLRIYICQWSYHGCSPDRRILDLLLSRTRKLRSIHALFDEETATEFLQRFDKGLGCHEMFEALEEATIEGSFLVSEEASQKLWSFFLDKDRFPCLRKLNWSLEMNSLRIPYHLEEQTSAVNLTHLKLGFPPPMADCLDLLRRCINLQSLVVDFRRTTGASPVTYYPRDIGADHPIRPIAPPSSLRELTIKVAKPLTGRILSRYTKSKLDCNRFVLNVDV